MSRSGLVDDDGDDPLAFGRWRGAVKSAIKGRHGQKFLRELAEAMDEMPAKVLVADELQAENGCLCTLGVIAKKRGLDLSIMDIDDYDAIASDLGVNAKIAQEIMFENDEAFYEWEYVEVEICGPMRERCYETGWRHETHVRSVRITKPDVEHKRWLHMRAWVQSNLASAGQSQPQQVA